MRNIRLLQAVAALTALSVTATAFAQVEVKKQVIKRDGRVKERTRVYNGINQTPWYSVPVVRQQLNLTDDQYGQLNNSYNTAYTTYNTGITGLNDGLTDEQRAQQTAQLNGTFYTNWNQATNKVIVDPAARQRFNQAYWQYQHYGAFSDPTVRQQLNLTDAQIKQFQTYDRDWNNNMATWHNEYPNNQQVVIDNYNKAQQAYQTNVNTVLTPEQRQQWSVMVGKPYNFGPDVYFSSGVTTAKPVIK